MYTQATTLMAGIASHSIKNAVMCVVTEDPSKSGKPAAQRDVRVILQRTRQDTIGMPGGRIDPTYVNGKLARMETPQEAVVREFYEETGVRVRFVNNVHDNKIGSDQSYPLMIMETTIINGTAVFVAKWLCVDRMDTDAWKSNAKACRETSGIYAVRTTHILNYDGKPNTYLLHGGKQHPNGTRVRYCAIDSLLYLQRVIKKFHLF